MTGKDLMLYILQNNLENQPIIQNGRFLDFMTVEETATKLDVGIATVCVWVKLEMIDSVVIGGKIFIPKTVTSPKGPLSNLDDGAVNHFIKSHS